MSELLSAPASVFELPAMSSEFAASNNDGETCSHDIVTCVEE